VPLKTGVDITGVSRDGVQISVTGEFGIQDSDVELTEQAMFTEVENLDAKLDVEGDTKYEFFIYYDSGSSTYRKFKQCSTANFDWDVGDDQNKLFTYAISIKSEDPVIYTTAEGA